MKIVYMLIKTRNLHAIRCVDIYVVSVAAVTCVGLIVGPRISWSLPTNAKNASEKVEPSRICKATL